MSVIAILIHGINVWDGGRGSVGKLRPFFADMGVPYVMVNYGHFGLLDTRFKNMRIADKVATAVRNVHTGGHQVIVVCHSNGCAIAHLAAREYGAEIDQAVYINPALDADIEIPDSIERLHVWHSPSDGPVKWAKYLPAANARPWGEMGATGYTGTDHRVLNFNKEERFDVVSDGHSDMFDIERIGYFGPIVATQAVAAISGPLIFPEQGQNAEGVQAGELRETGELVGISATS